MVKQYKLRLALAFISGFFILGGCSVDLFGLFGSTDLNKRWTEKDNFKFLSANELKPPSFGDEYSFIVLADTHIQDGDAFGLEKIKDVIQVKDNNVKFVVIAGDITQNGSRQDVQKFIEIARSFGVPCYPVIGNHDVYFSNWPVWKEFIGSTCYQVNGENAALFILDSANGYFGREQLDWLQSGLKKTSRRVFVFTHANLFVESPADIQQLTDTNERARIISLLSGHCDTMFTGHLHKRIVKKAGDVEYISIEDFKGKQTYCLVSVKQSGVSYVFKKL